jgi:hypothetical protein
MMIPKYQNLGDKSFSYRKRKQIGETFLLFWALSIRVLTLLFILVYITVDMMSLFCIHNAFLIRKL